jgi:hypothetical protein
MIRILIVTGTPPTRPTILAEALRLFSAAGASVTIAGAVTGETVPPGIADLITFAPLTPRQRRRNPATTPAETLWSRIQRHHRTRQAAARADVIVALDQPAIQTVWELARRHRGAEVMFGLAPALRYAESRSHRPWRLTLKRIITRGPSAEFVLAQTRRRYQRAITRA